MKKSVVVPIDTVLLISQKLALILPDSKGWSWKATQGLPEPYL